MIGPERSRETGKAKQARTLAEKGIAPVLQLHNVHAGRKGGAGKHGKEGGLRGQKVNVPKAALLPLSLSNRAMLSPVTERRTGLSTG